MSETKRRLRREATLTEADGEVRISSPAGSLGLRNPSDRMVAALRVLAAGDATDTALAATVGEAGLLRWNLLLRRLAQGGLLEYGTPAARLRPIGAGPVEPGPPPAPGTRLRLSRFAVVTAEDGVLSVRGPRSPAVVELAPEAAGLLGALADWTTPAELDARAGWTTPAELGADDVLRFLAAAGALTTGTEDGDEDGDLALAQWQPRDLWLHAHSRGSRIAGRYGGTYPFKERFEPLPVNPAPFGGKRIELTAPDLDAPGPSLTETLERRRSVREHDQDAPITLDQLGELLYRSMRQRAAFDSPDGQRLADRPYPSGGSVHELEVYPLVVSCRGLDPGLWHYDTAGHALELVSEPSPAVRTLVQRARSAALLADDPQVLLIVTARFGRVMWKYETIAYSLVLKHVGVLYQTIYLVGTAMNLAVCGLGGGDADDFARASGLDYLSEGSVGELVLGSRRG
ncbi:SagB family peptide dehydrogenase [Nonomuraea sp. NPDC048882]|uniref:SagB/ThcOx family dehydrogenase n=1 Tax=unclassified Nonomuraea TaxID=2593643 RepID=UPI00340478D1